MDQNQPALQDGVPAPDLQPGSLNRLTDEKLATFVIGNQKKSRFQKVCTYQRMCARETCQQCAWYSRVVYSTFAVGMGALLVAAALYVYGRYVVQYKSPTAAVVFCSMMGLAFLVGATMVIDVAEKKLQLIRHLSLQSSSSKNE